MPKFNDSSLVSACLNYEPETDRAKPNSIRHHHKQLDEHFDSLRKQMYLSQYKLDFKAPLKKLNINLERSKPAESSVKSDVKTGCRCPKCLGSQKLNFSKKIPG